MSELRTSGLPKRFYTSASVAPEESGHAIRLDGRPLKTPGRRTLLVPRKSLAQAIADEWEAQGSHIDPASMPVTRLANTIVDGVVDDPDPVRSELKRYAETDLLFYRADEPVRLADRQAQGWDPVLRWAEARIGGLFLTGTGVMHLPQPAETLAAFGRRLDQEVDPFALGGMHQMASLTGSLILALSVVERHLSAEEAWRLAHIDEDWNIEQWGADEEAEQRRERRFMDMRAAELVSVR